MAAQTFEVPSDRHLPFWKQRRWESTIAFCVFVSPMLIGLGLFTFLPIVWGFLISLSDARNTVSISEFVGLDNYEAALRDEQFRRSLRTIVIFTIFVVPLTFAVSLGLAMLVNSIEYGRAFFRTVFFIPTAVSYVIASLIWRMGIFNGVFYGVANMVLYEWFGYEDVISWISPPPGDPPWYWLVLVSVRLWLQVGFYMIIFIAGLQEIPRDLYEAAYVDGGTARLAHVPRYYAANAAEYIDRGAAAELHRRVPGVRRVHEHLRQHRRFRRQPVAGSPAAGLHVSDRDHQPKLRPCFGDGLHRDRVDHHRYARPGPDLWVRPLDGRHVGGRER